MGSNLLHDLAIVAVHNTVQGRRVDLSEDELLAGAMHAVLNESGLSAKDVDGCNVHSLTQGITGLDAITWLGGRPSWFGMQWPGIGAVLEAAGAIATGQCTTVMLAAAQAGAHRQRAQTAPWTRPDNEFVACWGLFTPAHFALIARRHMHLYGTSRDALTEVATTIRNNGARNPGAIFYGQKVTAQEITGSRMIADPFHLLDCAMTSEGGAALLLTTKERAKDLDATPIYILGGACDRQGAAYTMAPSWDAFGDVGGRAARICFNQSGLGPSDVDFCEFYDPFSFEIIRQLEAFGFCKPGEGGDFVLDGHIRMGGRLPIVTNGGLMSFSHPGTVPNLQKVIAGVMQLRGQMPGELTVAGARVGLVTNNGAGALLNDVMLLGRGT